MTDSAEIASIQKKMEDARTFLRNESGRYAEALQVRKFSDLRCKQLLASKMKPILEAGKGANEARALALGGEEYAKELDQLAAQYKASEEVIAKYEAAQVSFRAAQSLLSYNKTMKDFV